MFAYRFHVQTDYGMIDGRTNDGSLLLSFLIATATAYAYCSFIIATATAYLNLFSIDSNVLISVEYNS